MRRHLEARPEHDDDLTALTKEAQGRTRRPIELAAWLALGLAVAVVLVITTQHDAKDSSGTTNAVNTASTSVTTLAPSPQRRTSVHQSKQRSSTSRSKVAVIKPPLPTSTTQKQATDDDVKHLSHTKVTNLAPVTTTVPLAVAPTLKPPSPTTLPVNKPQQTLLTTSAWQGQLDYPADIATSILFSTTGGVVRISTAWTGVNSLTVTLRCPGETRSVQALLTASVALRANSGLCRVSIGELSSPGAPVNYEINASYKIDSSDTDQQ